LVCMKSPQVKGWLVPTLEFQGYTIEQVDIVEEELQYCLKRAYTQDLKDMLDLKPQLARWEMATDDVDEELSTEEGDYSYLYTNFSGQSLMDATPEMVIRYDYGFIITSKYLKLWAISYSLLKHALGTSIPKKLSNYFNSMKVVDTLRNFPQICDENVLGFDQLNNPKNLTEITYDRVMKNRFNEIGIKLHFTKKDNKSDNTGRVLKNVTLIEEPQFQSRFDKSVVDPSDSIPMNSFEFEKLENDFFLNDYSSKDVDLKKFNEFHKGGSNQELLQRAVEKIKELEKNNEDNEKQIKNLETKNEEKENKIKDHAKKYEKLEKESEKKNEENEKKIKDLEKELTENKDVIKSLKEGKKKSLKSSHGEKDKERHSLHFEKPTESRHHEDKESKHKTHIHKHKHDKSKEKK